MKKLSEFFAGVAFSGLMVGCSALPEQGTAYPDDMPSTEAESLPDIPVIKKKSACGAFMEAIRVKSELEATGRLSSPVDEVELTVFMEECQESVDRALNRRVIVNTVGF